MHTVFLFPAPGTGFLSFISHFPHHEVGRMSCNKSSIISCRFGTRRKFQFQTCSHHH
jgi:hypothetical protein